MKERELLSGKKKKTKITIINTRDFKPLYNIDTIIKSIPYVVGKYPGVKYILKNWSN